MLIDRRLAIRIGIAALMSSHWTCALAVMPSESDRSKKSGGKDADPDPFKPENWLQRSGDDDLDRALIAELRSIIRFLGVNPGFKLIKQNQAFATVNTIVDGTKGSVLLGIPLMQTLMRRSDGGVAVAGVCAHECSHIYQYEHAYVGKFGSSDVLLLELHADLLAGYYLGRSKKVTTNQLRAFASSIFDFGDYSYSDPSFHGSPGQRAAAIDKGFLIANGSNTLEQAAEDGASYVRQL
jgi:hypothetical protein